MKTINIILAVAFIIWLLSSVVLINSLNKVSKDVESQGGLAKTLGQFAHDFECTKNNDCSSCDLHNCEEEDE